MGYSQIKKILRTLLPRPLLFRLEALLRFPHYLSLAGRRYHCPVCGAGLRNFIGAHGERICPRCGSIERVRRLSLILHENYLKPGIQILDFSPSRSLFRKLRKGPYAYTASDLSGDFVADVAWDICGLPAEENSYDLILCYHILEHVGDDKQAMRELFRVLKPGGSCLVQTPFREGEIYENPEITSPGERKEHFGQEDHVRLYSAQGLKLRLEEAGFRVELKRYTEDGTDAYGLKSGEVILFCNK